MTPHETINTEAQVAPGGAAQVRRSWTCSDVWQYFHLSTGGGAVTATCKSCGKTLRASSKKHGTSQLWRHVRSKTCQKLQQQQAPLLPAPQAPSSAEPAAQQRCDPQEKAAVSTPHGYGASSAAAVGDDYDEERFRDLQIILSPRSERLLSSEEIDFVSDQAKNPTAEAPKSHPPGPGNIRMPQKARRSFSEESTPYTSSICAGQAAQRRHASPTWLPPPYPPPPAAGPAAAAAAEASPAGEQHDNEGFVERIANLYDELVARGLVFIQGGGDELAGAGDGHSPNYARMPQAVSPSSKRFFQKKKERFARSAPYKRAPMDGEQSSDANKEWTTEECSMLGSTDFTFRR